MTMTPFSKLEVLVMNGNWDENHLHLQRHTALYQTSHKSSSNQEVGTQDQTPADQIRAFAAESEKY